MRGMIILTMAGLGLGLAACGPGEDAVRFDGNLYSTKLKSERGARANFLVTARPVSASLLGAREAARYEATVYCVNSYGSSAIEWVIGPDSPDESLPIDRDTLTLQGVCPE